MNFYDKKTKRLVASVIAAILCVAMLLPLMMYAF